MDVRVIWRFLIGRKAMKVLILDDEEFIRELLYNTLIDFDYQITMCSHGEEALKILESEEFPLVITDLMMPDIDGYEVCRKIRKLPEGDQTFILMMTAFGAPDVLRKVLKAGADDYLPKPFKIDMLEIRLEVAKKLIDSRRRRKKAEAKLKQTLDNLERLVAERTQELRYLSNHLQEIIERDRKHYAREIHDELGQALTGLNFDLFWLKNHLSGDKEMLIEKINAMSRLLEKTSYKMERIITELRPQILDELGLKSAIEWQIGEYQKRTGINFDFTASSDNKLIGKELSLTLFRIFQEAVINAMRHSKANHIGIVLEETPEIVSLQIRDNGKGITEEEIKNPRSFGLIGIQERVKFWNGEVEIRGKEHEGTEITVNIPVSDDRKTVSEKISDIRRLKLKE
jgi:signal transduction histidine kinase